MEPSRKEIWKMFDAIAGTYDAANRLITGGIDRRWRKKMAEFLPEGEDLKLLDCATGTGDQLFALLDNCPRITNAVGIDLAQEMLKLAKTKLQKKPYREKVEWQHASASVLPFPDESFDCLTISFGIRNVEDLKLTLQEFRRVLKKDGRLIILETSIPQNRALRSLHLFYIRHILPRLGGFISKNPAAYRYLNQTTETFPCGDALCTILRDAGFPHTRAHPQTFGAATIYTAK